MQTQISCPQCRAPIVVDVQSLIDVGRQPELKQLMLSGALNVAMCSKCGWAGQLGAPLVYHDPAHDLLISFVPMELNLPMAEQERLVGQMVRQVVDNTPPEKRRAYMLQPQQMFRYQTLLEKVLETEGVTPEMLARQREQVALLREMIPAEGDALSALIAANQDKIDNIFLTLLQSALDSAAQANRQTELIALTNLQARLLDETEAGRQLLRQRVAVHHFNQDAKQANGVTPKLLLKHILANKDDASIWQTIATAGGQGLSYEFFSLLSQEVENAARRKDKALTTQLTEMRSQLLGLYDAMQEESRQVIARANETLQALMTASDIRAAVQAHLDEIDDAFMYVLSEAIEQSRAAGRHDMVGILTSIHKAVEEAFEDSIPEAVRFVSRLLTMDSAEDARRALDENPDQVNQDLLALLQGLARNKEADPALSSRARQLEGMVAMRVR